MVIPEEIQMAVQTEDRVVDQVEDLVRPEQQVFILSLEIQEILLRKTMQEVQPKTLKAQQRRIAIREKRQMALSKV